MKHSKEESQTKAEKYRLDGHGRVRLCMFTSPANQAPVPTDPVEYERVRQRLMTERDAKNNIAGLGDITLMSDGSEYEQDTSTEDSMITENLNVDSEEKPEKYRLDGLGRVRLCMFTSPANQAPVPTCPVEYERIRRRLIREQEVRNYLYGTTSTSSTPRHPDGSENEQETSSPTEASNEKHLENRVPMSRVFEDQGPSKQ